MVSVTEKIIPDEVIDEIVDEILKEIKPEEIKSKVYKSPVGPENEVLRLRNRVNELENRLNKLVENFKIVAIETSREISERVNNVIDEKDKQIVQLESQIEALRTAMIRLSNRLKELEARQ